MKPRSCLVIHGHQLVSTLYVVFYFSHSGTGFGAVLDMVTDRCATTCLICVLCFFYPSWLFLWQLLIALDIGSHWIQMYSSLLHGETSHKVTDLSANPIMRFYYSDVCIIIGRYS